MKYGVIPDWLIRGYYKALLWKSQNQDGLRACPFCSGAAVYVDQVKDMEIAYCTECWASAPIQVWQRPTCVYAGNAKPRPNESVTVDGEPIKGRPLHEQVFTYPGWCPANKTKEQRT